MPKNIRLRRSFIPSKYELASNFIAAESRTVLDVGCRDAVLKNYLACDLKYTGVDICPGPYVDHVCNIENGIPLETSSYDVVFALDVLEHTNDIFSVFEELVRIARLQIIVSLPNMYHWRFRLRYLFGCEMGKYILPLEPIVDRHRWLTSYRTTHNFCHHMAKKYSLKLQERYLFGGRRSFVIDAPLSLISRNLAVWSTVFAFKKTGVASSV